jgi:hypothetical protein
MKEPLWRPSQEKTNSANFTRFMTLVNHRHHTAFADYFALYEWSVNSIPDFWAAVWDFLDIKASKKYETIVDDLSLYPAPHGFQARSSTSPRTSCGTRTSRPPLSSRPRRDRRYASAMRNSRWRSPAWRMA